MLNKGEHRMNLDNISVDGYSSSDAFIEDIVDDILSCWDESEIEKLILEGGYEDIEYDF